MASSQQIHIVVRKHLIFLLLLLGLFFTAWGLQQQEWPSVLPWSSQNAFLSFAGWILVGCLFFIISGRFHRRGTIWAFCAATASILILTGNLLALAFIPAFVLASFLVGSRIFTILGIRCTNRHYGSCFLAGAGAYGTLVSILAHFPVSTPGLYGILIFVPLILNRKKIVKFVRDVAAIEEKVSPRHRTVDLIGAIVASVALVHFSVALLPELGYDALALHLFVPSRLASDGLWAFDATLYAWAVMPMLADWIFSIGYMLAGETGARLVNLLFTYTMAYQGYHVARWAGGSDKASKWAALLFLSTPLTFTETSSLHIEAVWGAYIIAGAVTVARVALEKHDRLGSLLRTSALMFGFAAAAKAVTLPMLPAAIILILFRWRYWLASKMLHIIVSTIVFLAVAVIPYVTAWLITGNPVFPFFNAIFASSYFPTVNFDNSLYASGVTWDLFYRMIFSSGNYLEASNGASGFQWLTLAPVAVLVLLLRSERKSHVLLLFIVISFYLVFYSQSYLRYVFPLFLMTSTLICVAIWPRVPLRGIPYRVLQIFPAIVIALNLLFLPSGTGAYRDLPFDVLRDATSRTEYLHQRLPIRLAVEAINKLNTQRLPVAFFSTQPFAAGLHSDALHPNWYNYDFFQQVQRAVSATDLASLLTKYNSEYLILESNWGEATVRELIEVITTEVASFGSVSVRRLLPEYQHAVELVQDPELESLRGWSLTEGVLVSQKGVVTVTRTSPITQAVPVTPRKNYIAEVVARCASNVSQGRVQVNWLDSKGDFLATSIRVFDCTKTWASYRQEVTAPASASVAVVYGTSHDGDSVQLSKLSLR